SLESVKVRGEMEAVTPVGGLVIAVPSIASMAGTASDVYWSPNWQVEGLVHEGSVTHLPGMGLAGVPHAAGSNAVLPHTDVGARKTPKSTAGDCATTAF